MGITNLCDAQPPSGELSPVLAEIFLVLARQAERDVRKILSERLAHADWAPRALVNVLALDEIEIARPIIAASPILQDEDLLKILLEATIDHQIEVARRPQLSGRVADAIIDRGEPASLTALAGNTTAEISGDGLRRLVDQSRRIAALRSPLTRHPRLGDALAQELYRWVGVALRQSIADRFNIDTVRLDAEIEAATAVALSPPGALTGPENPAERDEMDRRLIDKLKAADQLRAGYLIRAVREGRLGLFSHGLAALGGFTHGQILQALGGKTPEALYYACAAVGIDRAVFPPLLAEIRKLGSGPQDGSGPAVWLRGAISEASAARSFRALVPADA
ncbi:DUF2336 domain-containing protein [Rhizobium sp. CRIBSB]|nr:DUF2336 domain-containing protein [Rhizobium sp. CRIBSB]